MAVLNHPETFDLKKLQKAIARTSGINGSIEEQLEELGQAIIAPSQRLNTKNPLYRGMTVQMVRRMVEALGYRSSATMGDLFLQVMKTTQDDPEELAFQRVRLRSNNAEGELLAEEGGTFSDAEFAKKLGVRSRSTIQNYREKNKVFAIPRGQRNLRYPAWQIHNKQLLSGLAETLTILVSQNLSPFDIALFFLTEAEAIGDERPLELLRRNEVDEVIAHAHRYADRT